MYTYGLPQESELIVSSRKAAYCARRRLSGGGDILTAQDMEDMIQAATMTYWKHHREGRRAYQDREHHGGDFDGLERTLPDHAEREAPVQRREQDGTDAADR